MALHGHYMGTTQALHSTTRHYTALHGAWGYSTGVQYHIGDSFATRAFCRPPVANGPMTYGARKSEVMRRDTKRAAQHRWATQNRLKYLECKRRWAARPETLARRRELYLHRDDPKPPPPIRIPPPPPPTLDLWAKDERLSARVQRAAE